MLSCILRHFASLLYNERIFTVKSMYPVYTAVYNISEYHYNPCPRLVFWKLAVLPEHYDFERTDSRGSFSVAGFSVKGLVDYERM